MPTVIFRFAPRVFSGQVRPYRRFILDDVVHLPLPERIGSRNGVTRRTLVPSDDSFCYEVTEPDGTVRYVVVPDVAGPLEYADLTEVDPATLDPAAEPTPIWDAALASLVDRVADLESAAPGGGVKRSYEHPQNIPSTLWDVEHDLGYKPGGVLVHDAAGETWLADVEHLSDDRLLIHLGETIAGTAYLS